VYGHDFTISVSIDRFVSSLVSIPSTTKFILKYRSNSSLPENGRSLRIESEFLIELAVAMIFVSLSQIYSKNLVVFAGGNAAGVLLSACSLSRTAPA
jgi:hypothetical protein